MVSKLCALLGAVLAVKLPTTAVTTAGALPGIMKLLCQMVALDFGGITSQWITVKLALEQQVTLKRLGHATAITLMHFKLEHQYFKPSAMDCMQLPGSGIHGH